VDMRPTGDQHDVASGPYAATVTEVGASLRSLTHGGTPLVRGFGADEMPPVSRGAVLAPWPNRIGDGRYEFGGATHQVPLNEVDRRNALHGLVSWAPWRLVDRTTSHVVLGHRQWPSPGYPYLLDLQIAYALNDNGLSVRLSATNAGDMPAPYGCSMHPYLAAGPGHVDAWTLDLPATHYLEVDPDRLLPRDVRPVDGSSHDFRGGRIVGEQMLDTAYTGVTFGADGTAVARVTDADGSGVALHWDTVSPWVQVYTADGPKPALDRTGLALEPMTCPPDAFRSGTDLVVLEPGDSHAVTWRISALA